ncbi:MAG: Cache 3/Cache 2 fusion domain-containing protein [Planctomycetota bacterium]
MTLGRKIILLSVGTPVVFGAVVVATLAACKAPVDRALNEGTQVAVDGVSDTLTKSAEAVIKDVWNTCQIRHAAAAVQLENNLRVTRRVVADGGGLSLGDESIRWEMQNQFTGEQSPVSLPKMQLGGDWLGKSTSFNSHALIRDPVTEMLGCTATVFQRVNAAGDMLRVSTSVRKKDGSRGVGNSIPATNPDGAANPVVASLLAGEVFRGRAFVVDGWQLTAYEPVRNARGEVIGAAANVADGDAAQAKQMDDLVVDLRSLVVRDKSETPLEPIEA